MKLSLSTALSSLRPTLRYLFILMIAQHVAADDDDDSTKITANFTEPATGILMQRFFGAKSGFGFAIAVPDTPSTANATSFIGHMTFPLANGAGWGGWSLTGDMEGPLLMAAWLGPDGGSVVSSFRQADNEDDNPPEVTGAFTVLPIAEATSANSSFLTYTFLCEGCLASTFGLGPDQTAATVEMGWALGSKAVGNPESSAAVLNFHNVGFGGFQAQLGLARLPQADFDRVAALAGPPAQPAAGAVQFAGDNGGEGDDSDDSEDEDDD
ncbi:hypothetical protein PFICI_09588 [Pestalotiopsis fici W106-1]|uniref:Cellobiose dehydrogenase-like cytochrome domain-containing protein n=1 Tax=Pestalotiopsis fici (strain W106-1 / CGMCC3.15140) TaxID=1229662 RepID=W3X0Z9_PESFW|nr:uncharacterized protein PFICI_09588 [Pestalotiopsis fici W106-1]ETS79735.1 hypothetical protein PFICI_09588 [Pestalotiopsis fici W106-1]